MNDEQERLDTTLFQFELLLNNFLEGAVQCNLGVVAEQFLMEDGFLNKITVTNDDGGEWDTKEVEMTLAMLA